MSSPDVLVVLLHLQRIELIFNTIILSKSSSFMFQVKYTTRLDLVNVCIRKLYEYCETLNEW